MTCFWWQTIPRWRRLNEMFDTDQFKEKTETIPFSSIFSRIRWSTFNRFRCPICFHRYSMTPLILLQSKLTLILKWQVNVPGGIKKILEIVVHVVTCDEALIAGIYNIILSMYFLCVSQTMEEESPYWRRCLHHTVRGSCCSSP